jgi:hypothetical protein
MFNAGNDIDYKLGLQPIEGEENEDSSRRKMYRRSRASRPTRRRARKAAASHPGYGIAGRRNRRWTW